jgi:signal transduction histidine kinase
VKAVYRPLKLYGLIVVLYVTLTGWWVYFFSTEGGRLVDAVQSSGGGLSPAQVEVLREVSARTGRMFLYESAFLGLLMVGSVWLVLRAIRRELHASQQQRDFLNAVTHELRSPIASARLYLESILLGRTDEERTERYLRHTQEDLQRLGDMVEDLLASQRAARVGISVERHPADLVQLVSGPVDRMVLAHEQSEIRVERRGEGPVPVLADRAAIERIVDNLLANAVKYGGENPHIIVSVSIEGERAVLSVRDHGPGLSGADPESIFEPFVRGGDEMVRTQRGVGLGLSIVRELVKALDGTVSARDGLAGGGTVMQVSLPLHHSADGRDGASQ